MSLQLLAPPPLPQRKSSSITTMITAQIAIFTSVDDAFSAVGAASRCSAAVFSVASLKAFSTWSAVSVLPRDQTISEVPPLPVISRFSRFVESLPVP